MHSPVGRAVMVVAAAAATATIGAGVVVALRPSPGGAHVGASPASTADPWAWQKPDVTGKITYNDIYSTPVPAGLTAAAEVPSTKAWTWLSRSSSEALLGAIRG